MPKSYNARVLTRPLNEATPVPDLQALLEELLEQFQAVPASEPTPAIACYAAGLPVYHMPNKSIFPDFSAQPMPPLHSSVRPGAQARTAGRPRDPRWESKCRALVTQLAAAKSASPDLAADNEASSALPGLPARRLNAPR